uniref:Uncharacterized protein n=1 Tax=Fagus sylvatica TaxID=28930 RepID=A0A2N9F2T2_FAGSY
MSKKGGAATLQKDAPWRASPSLKPIPKIHHSPLLRLPQTPHSNYALSVMKHPNPIGSGLAMDAIVEAAGPECIVPGQITPIKLLGLKLYLDKALGCGGIIEFMEGTSQYTTLRIKVAELRDREQRTGGGGSERQRAEEREPSTDGGGSERQRAEEREPSTGGGGSERQRAEERDPSLPVVIGVAEKLNRASVFSLKRRCFGFAPYPTRPVPDFFFFGAENGYAGGTHAAVPRQIGNFSYDFMFGVVSELGGTSQLSTGCWWLQVWPIDVNLKFLEPVGRELKSIGKFMDDAVNLMNKSFIDR